jgi:ribonucrease Y
MILEILFAIAGAVIGAGVAWVTGSRIAINRYDQQMEAQGSHRLKQAEAEARDIIGNATDEARATVKQAEQESRDLLQESEQTTRRRRRDLDREDERLQRRRDELDKRFERLETREQNLNRRQGKLDKRETQIAQLEEQKQADLTHIAQMTVDEAREEVMYLAEQEARLDMARIVRQVESEAREVADTRARSLIAMAIQRLASEYVAEIAVSVVQLPSDDMKGRIIGRNGRNIRSFELAAGVDVVVDDTPEAVTISSFDPVRREVATIAMTKLVSDGRIHPARIEKLVEDAREEVETGIQEEGEHAAYITGVHGLHPEILKLLGRLKFRTSYGQNQHAHAIETANLAGMIAAELGADVNIAKMGGLLHDIGKAIDHQVDGTHAAIGAEYAQRYGVPAKVVNCIAAHHHEIEQECVEAYIVEAADAISGARPGARRESLEAYIKRVKTLEEVATSFEGVQQSYALQAGREVRIIVRPDVVDDLTAMRLSRDIARKIEDTLQYPGQIKVQVIRETRSIEYAN